ncbi:hypothetical protein ACM01_01425 [Streptomyces viridochromogenes]|uniref:Uncharacterized protein n=1 Tax=Streptomyces viridochromogenes TaxID=1938 RepID=A0A0J7ZPJ9_STRVR|nr:hypothetical protein [Streptomyces viridochromogenes]KMS77317.1 hypothetical protein ACM01_01425 [Streptomyces viridochromogenes]KOG19040.1 hypothetical protein ADK36_20555 [Streptomyces viridochromogenes]KOG19279.1 hypothetical protein ADK35_20415 [Streptomyces viridochromogenes]
MTRTADGAPAAPTRFSLLARDLGITWALAVADRLGIRDCFEESPPDGAQAAPLTRWPSRPGRSATPRTRCRAAG